MFNSSTGYSLADIAAVTEGNNCNNGFGTNGDGWWIILLLLFAYGGFGYGGFGYGGRSGVQGTTTREEISYGFDMNGLENGIRGIQQGLCDGFYAQNSTMLQGFNGVASEVAEATRDLQSNISQCCCDNKMALMQGFNGIQAQMSQDALVAQQCCCDTQNLISSKFCDLNYNIATQGCDTRRAISDSTRDIIDSQNSGTRAILDFLTQDKIATLQAENQSLKFAASQANQNVALGAMMDANTAEILRRTAPIPVPAYLTCSPYSYHGGYGVTSNYGCGCNSGCAF